MTFVMIIVAYILIYTACDYGRPQEHRFSISDYRWWVQVGLVTAGGIILYNLHSWF